MKKNTISLKDDINTNQYFIHLTAVKISKCLQKIDWLFSFVIYDLIEHFFSQNTKKNHRPVLNHLTSHLISRCGKLNTPKKTLLFVFYIHE